MADETLTETDDDDLVVVEMDELPAPGAPQAEPKAPDQAAAAAEDDADDDEDDDDDDDDDERLATDQDELDDEVVSKSRQKRLKRREARKAARDRLTNEVQELRRLNATLIQRVDSLEGGVAAQTVQQLDAQLAAAQQDVANAEAILAHAIEAGNGADASEALRLRDAAKEQEMLLRARKETAGQPRRTADAAPNPNVATFGRAWISQNPWYDPNPQTQDPVSIRTRQLDEALVREGYNPGTIEFWKELTNRVNAEFAAPAAQPKKGKAVTDEDTPTSKRKGPPVAAAGGAQTNVNGRREVYVTPARKQAMMEAGVWDDPELRKKYLKAYRDYDNQQSAS